MTEQIIINATQPEEVRVAFIRDTRLFDLMIQNSGKSEKKGNIYKAVVTRREPSLDAVFVEYGAKRQGFLPLKEIASEYLSKNVSDDEERKLPITSLIREGQELLIQVDKEERGNKGAALTTYITLPGCYLVLMPNSPRSGGISRRIEGEERDELRETLNALELPDEMGLIIRTAGVGKSQEELQDDLNMLCNQWQSIKHAYQTELAPCLIHQEGDVIIRSVRDNFRKSTDEIIIDEQMTYIKVKQYIEQVKPEEVYKVKFYQDRMPIFMHYYGLESQIKTTDQRQVMLPSGGALVIDKTEALVSIDINSAKATGGADIEATALNTNLEAADEIARQLRLRDLGGLVVIDFIDMSSSKNQRDVENRLKEALEADRARIQVGRISRFGLLEMSRQRLRLPLGETAQEVCPLCEGRGTVRNIQSHALTIIRLIEEEALKEKTAEIQVQLPPMLATFLMNEKRDFMTQIEKKHKVHVVVVANPYLESPHYLITRLKEDNVGRLKKPSYSLIQQPEVEVPGGEQLGVLADEPVLKGFDEYLFTRETPDNFLVRLWRTLFSRTTENQQKMSEPLMMKEEQLSESKQLKKPGALRRQTGHSPSRRRRPMGGASHAQQRHLGQASHQNQQRKRSPGSGAQAGHQSSGRGAIKTEGNKKRESAVEKDQTE